MVFRFGESGKRNYTTSDWSAPKKYLLILFSPPFAIRCGADGNPRALIGAPANEGGAAPKEQEVKYAETGSSFLVSGIALS
jgi:hypothetical protein